jgi:transposase
LLLEEYGFEVCLVNAKHVKNVSGRKTDELDCQWIQKLHSFGLLTASYQPDLQTRALRSYVRHRKNLIQSSQVHLLRMQKALEQMNIKIQHVITDITGKTGTAIIDAILAGERDTTVLSNLIDARIRATKEEVKKSLEGNWQEVHLFELKQSRELWDFYRQKIADCTKEIEAVISDVKSQQPLDGDNPPISQPKEYLNFIYGVDVTAIWGIKENTAIELLAEIGPDMSKWKTEKHFSSWLGISPNNKISGGKIISSKTQKKQNKAGQLFKMIAYAIQRSDHWLAVFYRRIRAKGGPRKAIVATAHKLAIIFYKMVKTKQAFNPLKKEDYENIFKQQKIRQLEKQARKLGLVVAPC